MAVFFCALYTPGLLLLLLLLHVVDILFDGIAKLITIVQPVRRNQSDACKIFVVPPGFHGMPFSLGRMVMYHGNAESLPDVPVDGQQLLAEDIEAAMTFLSVLHIRLYCFVESEEVINLPPDDRIYLF